MNFKQFLLENEESNFDELVRLINSNCSKNFKTIVDDKKFLYRGEKDLPEKEAEDGIYYFLRVLRTTPRKSKTDFNFVNSYVSAADDWEDLPNRIYSIFTSTDINHTSKFGKSMLVIPFDNCRFATSFDDWNSLNVDTLRLTDISLKITYLVLGLSTLIKSMSEDDMDTMLKQCNLNSTIHSTISKFLAGEYSPAVTVDLLKILSKIQKYVDNKDLDFEFESIAGRFSQITNGMDIRKWFKKFLTPENLGINVYDNFQTLVIPETDSPEIWFTGQYIMLSIPKRGDLTNANSFINRLRKAIK